MRIIGFGHKKRVGKDTATKFAIAHYRQKGIDAQRCSFFDPVKDICVRLYSWGGLQHRIYYEENPLKKEEILPPIGRSPRQIWDQLGSTIHELCPRTLPELALTRAEGDCLIIPDVRRPIECEYIHAAGGKVVLINRDSAPVSAHIVDNMLNDYHEWDYVLPNNGGLKELYENVVNMLEALDWKKLNGQ